MDVDAMRGMFEVNVFGLVDLTNRVVPLMKDARAGRHHQRRVDVGDEGRADRDGLRGQQMGCSGHQPMLAGRASAARHSRDCLCPSEVQTNFGGRTGRNNPNKLYAEDIAATIFVALSMPRRVLWPELAIFANNPWKED